MAFTRDFQDCRHFITKSLPEKLTGNFSPDSRSPTKQFLCRRLRQHDLLRIFLYQTRIAGDNRKTEYIEKGSIDILIGRFNQISARMQVQSSEIQHKSRILHLRKLFPEYLAQRCYRIDRLLYLSATLLLYRNQAIDRIPVNLKIFKGQLIHNPKIDQESSRHPQHKPQHINRRKQKAPFD